MAIASRLAFAVSPVTMATAGLHAYLAATRYATAMPISPPAKWYSARMIFMAGGFNRVISSQIVRSGRGKVRSTQSR